MSTQQTYGQPEIYQDEFLTKAIELDRRTNLRQRISDQAPGYAGFGVKLGGVDDSGNPNWLSWAKPLTGEESEAAKVLGYNVNKIRNPNALSPHLGLASAFDRNEVLNDPIVGQRRLELSMAQSARKTKLSDESRQIAIGQKDREDVQKFNLNLNTQNLNARASEVQEQGKLNMRQSMLDSVNARALAITSTPFRRLTQ